MARCIACGATVVGTRCLACSPEPLGPKGPRAPDPQQELGWQFYSSRGWRYAACAVPVLLGASVYVAAVDQDTGGSVFFALGAIAWAGYGIVNWRDDRES